MTRTILTAILLCLVLGATASAAPDPGPNLGDGFSAGNAAYAAGNFTEAENSYERQVSAGKYSANLFYNLADAYYRQGERGRAILNYERVLILDPAHAEAVANLAFVRGVKSVAPAPRDGWVATILPWIAAAAGWLGLAGVIVTATGKRRRVAGATLAGLGLAICAAGFAAVWFLGPVDNTGRAVVVADSAPVYYAPAENSKVVTTLTAGGEVRVLSDQGAWIYTLLSDGTRAWVASNKIERIVPP